jgi:hypothetical protein
MGGSEGASSRARLVSRGSGADIKRADCRKRTSALQARTRFEPISSRTGASPSFLRRLAAPACFELSFGSPFSRRNGRSSALIGAAIQRWLEHNMNKRCLSRRFLDAPDALNPSQVGANQPHTPTRAAFKLEWRPIMRDARRRRESREHNAFRLRHNRDRERSDAIQGNVVRPATPGSPRRFAPRDDGSDRTREPSRPLATPRAELSPVGKCRLAGGVQD